MVNKLSTAKRPKLKTPGNHAHKKQPNTCAEGSGVGGAITPEDGGPNARLTGSLCTAQLNSRLLPHLPQHKFHSGELEREKLWT